MRSNIGNKFVNYFTFYERLNTTLKKKISFYEFWEHRHKYKNKKSVKSLFKHKADMPDNKIWYDYFSLYMGSNNMFKPVMAMYLYYKYNPTSILDFTMGWGGRLVGATALDIPHYIGIDQNINLQKPYEDMVKVLSPLTKTNITLMFKDALKVDYSKLNYDMVFTSPPYDNLESYSNQQIPTDWDAQFYKPIITTTYRYLKNGGHYCLNVPVSIYDRLVSKILGKADDTILLPLSRRSKTSQYKEYIYIWRKT